jgi:hypothetical protein
MVTRDLRPVPQEPSDFDYDFRAFVIPRLERRARRLAVGVAAGRFSYSSALASLARYALACGGAHVTDFADLEDYLGSVLGDYALAALERGT